MAQARTKYKTNYDIDFQKTKPIRKKKVNEKYIPQTLCTPFFPVVTFEKRVDYISEPTVYQNKNISFSRTKIN